MDYVLGIDIGTGSVKAVAVDLQCRSFEVSQQHYCFSTPKPGYHEQNPEEIWDAFKISLKNIIDKIGSQPLALGLSSAMHSLVCVDGHGQALAPMMTWADNRSLQIAKNLRGSAEGIAIYKATGTPLHAMSPLCKIIWLRENDVTLFKQAYKFISIKEYIWHQLFGRFEVDHSVASGMGLFNIHNLTWHPEALEMAGIDAEKLSRPVPTDHTVILDGNQLDFIKTAIPFIIGASDGCLANLGSMATKTGLASITIGTSGAVRVTSSKALPNETAMTFSYILDQETFVCGGPINNGGIALQWWLKNNIGPNISKNDYELAFQQIAVIPAGSDGLIFLPYLSGERAPIWDSESCGNFFGVKLQHTNAHFTRAVLEGICYALKDVLDAVQQNSEPITQINISGGFVSSAVWVQTLADITGKKLAVVQTGDASAVGAAFMAMKSAGLIDQYPASGTADQPAYEPDPANTAIYSKGFTIYKQLYTNLKATMHMVYGEG
ncbi:gluconokinase [soil metagenome]